LRRLTPTRAAGLAAGLLLCVLIAALDTPLKHHPEWGARPAYAAAVAALMAAWWLTEAVPIYWTACVPLLGFPLLAVFGDGLGRNLRASLAPYFDPYIFLFAGGMAIAAAMQQWNLHRRIALTIMRWIGTDPRRLLAGLLAATAFVSLWISNTATATMMFPIGMALITQLEAQSGRQRLAHYGMAAMLAIAYGANVGGIGTKIGTAPNAQFSGFMERLGTEVSFLEFMLVGLPFVVAFLPIVWLALWRVARRDGLRGDLGRDVLARELEKLGPLQPAERIVLAVFLAAAALWIGGKALTGLLQARFPAAGLGSAHVEAGVAVAAALVLLSWRSRGRAVLAPRSLRTVPWETLLLLGGGFALAAGVQGSGLSAEMASALLGVRDLAFLAQVLLACLVTVAISAVASNTATTAIMLVVLNQAVAPAHSPTVLFASTLAASCDFALPAGTPPNAIVFGSGYVTIPRMARTGAVLDVAAALLAGFWCWLAVPRLLG
jgi:sodium-dependent dicarboxylate transporter 2/3/5